MIDTNLSFLGALPPNAGIVNVRSGLELSATKIRQLAAQKSGSLAAMGLQHGDRIVVAESDPLDYMISVFACWVAGLTAVAVNPAISAEEHENVLAVTGARHSCGRAGATVPSPVNPGGPMLRSLGLDEPALILMSSGTTGVPKGIVHSLRSLSTRAALNTAFIGHRTLRESLCVLPVFFGHGLIGNVLTPLFAGGRVHLWPSPQIGEMRNLPTELANRGITFMSSVPSFWKVASRLADKPRIPLMRIHVGSAPLTASLWAEISEWGGTRQVFNMFGMTETANWIGGGSLGGSRNRDGYVGRMWGGQAAVIDEAGSIKSSGHGEVVVQSPSIMLGYWQRPDLVDAAFAGNWFRTGDIGEIDEVGELTLLGRIKTEINRGGIKIQAEEVDMLLERHEQIEEACAFGVPDPVAGEMVAAAIVLKPGARFDPEAIKAWCSRHARPDAVPGRIDVIENLPRNDRGKVVRSEVRKVVELKQK